MTLDARSSERALLLCPRILVLRKSLSTLTHSWRHAVRIVALTALLAPTLAACAGGTGATVKRAAFTSKEYGVSVSPRVTTNPNPPKGGGRYQVGKPYTVK